LERSLYNAFLGGISLDGKSFFYDNPLGAKKKIIRKPWFRVPCCTTNIIRFLPQIPSYIYGVKEKTIFINLFIKNNAEILLKGSKIVLKQETKYPWEGNIKVSIELKKKEDFIIAIRIPGWARNKPVPSDLYYYLPKISDKIIIKVNEEQIDFKIEEGYVKLYRVWAQNDTIEVRIPMPIRRVLANKKVEENLGKVAIERGPIVFCVEIIDNDIDSVFQLFLSDDDKLEAMDREDLLNGITFITGNINFIPYYSWANRGKSEMTVWVQRNP
jgi:DUF1680 family protein